MILFICTLLLHQTAERTCSCVQRHLLLRQSADTIRKKHLLHILFMSFLCTFLCRLSGLSLAVRETQPDLLIDWLAKAQDQQAPCGGPNGPLSRDATTLQRPSCIFLIAFVSQCRIINTLNCQWIGQSSFLSRMVHFMYIITIQKGHPTEEGVAESFCPLFFSLTYIFFVFELQAPLSAERALRAFLYRLF